MRAPRPFHRPPWLWRLLGALAGLCWPGPLGPVLAAVAAGIVAGHAVDVLLARRDRQREDIVLFELLGCMARANGTISQAAIDHAGQCMQLLGAGTGRRHALIAAHQRGRDLPPEPRRIRDRLDAGVRDPARFGQRALVHLDRAAAIDPAGQPTARALTAAVRDWLAGRLAHPPATGSPSAPPPHPAAAASRSPPGPRAARTPPPRRPADRAATSPPPPRRPQAPQPAGPSADVLVASAILGVEPGIDAAALRLHYRRLLSKHHPDHLHGAAPAELQAATRKLDALRAAYRTLRRARSAAAAEP